MQFLENLIFCPYCEGVGGPRGYEGVPKIFSCIKVCLNPGHIQKTTSGLRGFSKNRWFYPKNRPKSPRKWFFRFFWRFFGKILYSKDVLPSLGHGKHRIV